MIIPKINMTIPGNNPDAPVTSAENQSLRGGAGDDQLLGGHGDDVLWGGAGNDVLWGGGGADRLDGDVGVDTVSYAGSSEAVTVYLWEGTGKRGHAEGDVIIDVENVQGSEYGDVLGGDGGVNVLFGGGGNDRLSGRGGDDLLEGGAGADRLSGGAGVDWVSYVLSEQEVTVDLRDGTGKGGHAEGDVIVDVENVLGSMYGDVLVGDDSANYLGGWLGDDVLWGGAGDDVLDGSAGVDLVSYEYSDRGVRVYLETGEGKGGHAEGDVIVDVENVRGSNYGDVLGGDNGVNWLTGDGGNDRLSGRGGNDFLEGGAGADRLIGGAGDDWASYEYSDRGVRVYLETGTGKGGHAEGDVITQVENVLGSGYGDVLGGDNGANWLDGGGGNDRLSGKGGNDFLEGGAGADRLIGGAGVDTVYYGSSDRGVIVYLSEGTGRRGQAEGDVIAQVENVLGSVHGDVLGGNNGANWLDGGGGNDRLSGRGGDDVLIGGAGADRLDGGAGMDWVSYARSDSGVVVSLASGGANRGHAAGDTIIDIENLEGSSYADQLLGDNAANSLRGRAGNDTLRGRAGNDTLDGGPGADRLFGDAGKDTVSYARSDSGVVVSLASGAAYRGHAAGDTIEDIENLEGSSYADRLLGDNAANSLRGRAGNDTLEGRAGNDTLDGGPGADLLKGGRGRDTFVFRFDDGDDTISDFTDGQDRIDLSEFDLSGFAALDISTGPAGVMIDLSAEGGGTVLLENFDRSDLDAGDFLFA